MKGTSNYMYSNTHLQSVGSKCFFIDYFSLPGYCLLLQMMILEKTVERNLPLIF